MTARTLLLFATIVAILIASSFCQPPTIQLTCFTAVSLPGGQFGLPFRVNIVNPASTAISNVVVTLQQPQLFVGNLASIPAFSSRTLTGTVTSRNPNAIIGPAVLSARSRGQAIAVQSGTTRCNARVTTRPPRVVDLQVTKNCTASRVFSPTLGQTRIQVCFDIFVRNVGNVPFTSFTLVESIQTNLIQPQTAQAIPVGQTVRVSGCFTPSNQNAAFFTNSVTVFATAAGEVEARSFGPVTARCPAPASVPTPPPLVASLRISKNCTVTRSSGRILVRFDVFIRNDGSIPFRSLAVFESESGSGAAPQTFIISSGLGVGSTTRISGSYFPSNPNSLSFTDQVVVQAIPSTGPSPLSFGPAFATCFNSISVPTPPTRIVRLDIRKNCTARIVGGQIEVDFDVFVTNIGNVPFTSLTLVESTGPLLAPQAAQAIPVGATVRVSGSYTPDRVNVPTFSDSVTVFATAQGELEARTFGPVTATCRNPLFAITTPSPAALVVTKNCTARFVGNRIIVFFDIFIRNTGNRAFSSISVLESEQGGAAPQTFILSSGLAVGASSRFSSSYAPSNPNASFFTDVVTIQAIPFGSSTPVPFGPFSATCASPRVVG